MFTSVSCIVFCRVVTSACYPYASGKTSVGGQCKLPVRKRGGDCPSGIQYKIDKRYKASPPYRIRPLVSLPSFGAEKKINRKFPEEKKTTRIPNTVWGIQVDICYGVIFQSKEFKWARDHRDLHQRRSNIRVWCNFIIIIIFLRIVFFLGCYFVVRNNTSPGTFLRFLKFLKLYWSFDFSLGMFTVILKFSLPFKQFLLNNAPKVNVSV